MKKTICKKGYEITDVNTGIKGCFIPHNKQHIPSAKKYSNKNTSEKPILYYKNK
jgi:hypothetical protein